MSATTTTPRWSLRAIRDALDALHAPCVLCEHRCGAMRRDGERGACGLDDGTVVYNRMLHVGEERELVPSYAIFLSGCSLLCSFCSEQEHLRPPFAGTTVTAADLAARVALHIEQLRQRIPLIRNINFVGGEPSIALPFIADFAAALEEALEAPPPLLLNTNGYLTPEAWALATHLCDLFVVDYKFGNDRCAESIGDIARYTQTLRRNLTALEAANSGVHQTASPPVRPVELWVRHLVMPGHLECCTRPCLAWLAQHLPSARVNVMPAFFPFRGGTNTRWPQLDDEERERARQALVEARLPHPYWDGRRLEPR